MLYYKLPFYGKRGSIGEIKESKYGIEVLTYDVDGKGFNESIIIRNTKNNRNDILDVFFKNVEEYLDKNKDKFFELKNSEEKVFLNRNLCIVILIMSILFGIGIPGASIILGTDGMFGAVILMICASFSTASIISLKKNREESIKKKFLKTYSDLSHEFSIYEEEKRILVSRNKDIKSRSLSLSKHDKDKSSVLVKTRIKDN